MSRLILLAALVFLFGSAGVEAAPPAFRAGCPIPPAFDPGVGELYLCSPAEGERYLIDYARRSYREDGLREDIWLNFRGVFRDQLWINVGTREANDTSLPAWEVIATLVERMQAIKVGERSALQQFLAPIEATPARPAKERAFKQRLLERLRRTAALPANAPLRAVLYHVHLRPTQEIEERSLMPINHILSIPSHTDLVQAPRLAALTPGAESKLAVPAGIWTYEWDESHAARFVADEYDGPPEAPFALKFARVYTRFAITEYHRRGFNDPAMLRQDRVEAYAASLQPTGAILRFVFATDWTEARETLMQLDQERRVLSIPLP